MNIMAFLFVLTAYYRFDWKSLNKLSLALLIGVPLFSGSAAVSKAHSDFLESMKQLKEVSRNVLYTIFPIVPISSFRSI